ncbi:MAG: TIM barrel protein [Eubacteriales bacterium]
MSKYDIIENIDYTPKYAIEQIEKEAKEVKKAGGKYLLVHFPFFAGECYGDPDEIIENGLKKLSRIQNDANIDIVCEPKLGIKRAAFGIEYMHRFPVDTWAKYGLGICIDIGDYVMVAGEDGTMEYIDKWRKHIKVVHLHNVDYSGGEYFWKPMHPDDEADGHHKTQHIIEQLAQLGNIYFVLEHTPHGEYSKEYVKEGIEWVEEMIQGKYKSDI